MTDCTGAIGVDGGSWGSGQRRPPHSSKWDKRAISVRALPLEDWLAWEESESLGP